MSITKNLGRSATCSKPSLSRPVGLGVWNVPSASQRSCQAELDLLGQRRRVAVRRAPSPGVCSALGWSAVWLIVVLLGPELCVPAAGIKKPLTQEGSPCCLNGSGQHGRGSRSRPVTRRAYRDGAGPGPRSGARRRSPVRGGIAPLRVQPDGRPADDLSVDTRRAGDGARRAPASSRGCLGPHRRSASPLFATGVGPRPAGAALGPALRRRPVQRRLPARRGRLRGRASVRVRAERLAWRALTVALLLYAPANAAAHAGRRAPRATARTRRPSTCSRWSPTCCSTSPWSGSSAPACRASTRACGSTASSAPWARPRSASPS